MPDKAMQQISLKWDPGTPDGMGEHEASECYWLYIIRYSALRVQSFTVFERVQHSH